MNKKLLAALVLSMAMAAPQVKAEPEGTPHDLYDTMVAGGDKVSLWTNQLINADLPKYTDKGLEINPYDETTQEPIGGYFGIESYNHHKGFELDYGASLIGFNIKEIYGFKTDGNGGAFNLTNDSSMTLDAAIDKDHPTDIYWNQAGGKGGAIFADYTWGGAVNLINTSVFHNKAHDKGGGIYIDYGALNIFANPGAEVEIIDNYQNCEYDSDGNLTGGTPNDIYATLGGTSSYGDRVRGRVKLHTMGKTYDPTDPGHTGAGSITVGHMVVDGAMDLSLGHSSRSTEDGAIDIVHLTLNNTASLNIPYNTPGEHGKLAIINIGELNMTNSAVLNTVNNYIDKGDYNFAIGTITLDNTDNKFFVDADLRGTPVIDEIGGVVEGGKAKLSVNIIGANTDAITLALNSDTTEDDGVLRGSMRLFTYGSTIIEGGETQYGGYRYSFSQDPNDKGIINYQVVKSRSISLQDALQDVTVESYDMPDLYVADSNLGQLYHFDPDTLELVPRTFTINGNNGVLIAYGAGDISGISIPQQLYPEDQDSLIPKLIVNDLEAFSGFTKNAGGVSFAEGGALDVHNAILEVDNVTFTGNKAQGTSGTSTAYGSGGAIYVSTNEGHQAQNEFKSTINNSTFINNKVISVGTSTGDLVHGGGAVFSMGNIDINDSLFAQNSEITKIAGGTSRGGALYVSDNSTHGATSRDVRITDTMFLSNVAGDVENSEKLLNINAYGGAISAAGVDMDISGSSFVDNKAQAAGDIPNPYMEQNYTGNAEGGAIYIDYITNGAPYEINIGKIDNEVASDRTTFIMNQALAVKSVDNGDGTYTLTSDGVDQSKARGGAIAIMPPSNSINKVTVNITDSDFISNESGNGGAVYNAGSNVVIKNSTFKGNRANHYYVHPTNHNWNEDMTGGAVYNGNGAQLTLDGVTFSSNYAKQITYDGETPVISTVKNDIYNEATTTGGLYFTGKASTLDGGISGYGYTYFNLDDDQTMTIAANTIIDQAKVEVNSGTISLANAASMSPIYSLTIGQNGTVEVEEGQFNIVSNYGELENNGTLNIKSGGFDFIADNVTLTNNGTLISSGLLTRDIAGDGTAADACKLILNGALDVQSDRTIAGTLDLNNKAVTMESETPSYNTLTVDNLVGTGRLLIDANMTINGNAATASDQLLIADGSENNANLILRSVNIANGIENNGIYENYITFLDTTDAVGATLEGITTYIGNLNNDGIATITSGGKQYTFNINDINGNKLDVTVGDVETTLAQFVQGDIENPATVTTYVFDDNVIVDENLGTTAERDNTPNDLYINLKGNELIALGDEVTGEPVYDGVTVDSGYILNVNGAADNPADPDGVIRGFSTAFIVNGATDTADAGVLNVSDVTFTDNAGAIFNEAGVVNIADSTFSNNVTTGEGGAILNGTEDNNSAILNLDNVTFTNNSDPEMKNDIMNYGTVNFVHNGSTLDGGVNGFEHGTTNFNLDADKTMTVSKGTYISQKDINVNTGTVVLESASYIIAKDALTNNSTLNVESGTFFKANDEQQIVNNGTMNIGSIVNDTVKDVETMIDLTNNGTINAVTAGDLSSKLKIWSGKITNNQTGTINSDIAVTPFASGSLTEEQLVAYINDTLDPENPADAELIALIEASDIPELLESGAIGFNEGNEIVFDNDVIDSNPSLRDAFGELENSGTINGNLGNKYGIITNNITGAINGDIDNKNGELYNGGAIVGDIDNKEGFLANTGIIDGNINNDGTTWKKGQLNTAGTINGDVINSNGSVVVNTAVPIYDEETGEVIGSTAGTINGHVFNNGTSIFSNNGTINLTYTDDNYTVDNPNDDDQFVYNEGTFTNNGNILGGLDNKGTFYNTVNGSLDATDTDSDLINNEAGAILVNAGSMTAADIINDGNMYNGEDPSDPEDLILEAAFFGDITNGENGILYNAGTIEGDVDNGYLDDNMDPVAGGQVVNDGIINGDTTNYGGTVVNNGTMNGYADNYNGYDAQDNEIVGRFENNGIIDTSQALIEQYVSNEGTYINNGTIIGGLVNDGQFFNKGTLYSTDTDSDYVENDGLIVNTGNIATDTLFNDATVVNGVNQVDPDSANPIATINADIMNSAGATVVNAGDITGNIYNETPTDNESPTTVYLYDGGTVNGNITGEEGSSDGLLILAGGNGTVNGDVNVEGIGLTAFTEDKPVGELHLLGDVNTESFYAEGGTLNLQNGEATTANLGEVTLNNNVNFKVDVDLNNNIVDAINGTFNEEDSAEGAKINISEMIVMDDSKTAGRTTLDVFNGDEDSRAALKDHISSSSNLRQYKPIFVYNGAYNSDTGRLRIDKTFNPAILVGPVAAQLGGYLTQLNSYDEAFRNMDMYMLMTSKQRQALKFRNKVASLYGAAYDNMVTPVDYPAGWFRPYATFEKVGLHKGPKVENTAWGSFFGGESSMKELGHGWDGMWGAYVGYNGSHQHYDGVSIYQNGGTLGLVGMAYKDNFFVGGTVNVGANAGEANTMYGEEDFGMLMSGVAAKGGYNWEFADGKFIIQPSLQTSYTFVNTFDYTNAAGVKINSDPLHAIQIEPGLKFIGNLKNGWQPYAGVSFIYNIIDKTHFRANDVSLPNLSINPYVKYGLGVRKTWGDKVTGHLQTFIMNGGRNGIGVQAGFRFAIGKEGGNSISGKTPELKSAKITLSSKNAQQ